MSKINVEQAVKAINNHLKEHDFRCPGADSDFRFGTDPGLRFKTGTVYGEVTVTIWRYGKQIDVIRILNDAQVVEAKHEIDAFIARWRAGWHDSESVR